MAKALLVSFRAKDRKPSNDFFRQLGKRMCPENINVETDYLFETDGVSTYVFNPSKALLNNKTSIALGCPLIGKGLFPDDLFRVEAPVPEGTFALFRHQTDQVEICTDYTASRTIWFYFTEEFFAVSTSQRMLVAAIGSFDPDPKTIGWSLSSGVLGPRRSWDKRIQYLPQNSRMLLNRRAWMLNLQEGEPIVIDEKEQAFEDAQDRLATEVKYSCENLDIDARNWVLALSGGMDSRSILYHLKNRSGLSAITWATARSHNDRLSDARISVELARVSGVNHQIAPLAGNAVPLPVILKRFVAAGEGRIDHLSGYMDGLKLWADLAKSGKAIIRGYDAFGRKAPVTNEYQVRIANEMRLTEESLHIVLPEDYRVTYDDIPTNYRRKANESLNNWRDRLWLQYRTPFVTAALDEIKVAYVEICNPLLSRNIVKVVQTLPERYRESKNIFASLVKSFYPEFPYAKAIAVQDLYEVVSVEGIRDFVNDELQSNDLPFPRELGSQIVNGFDEGRSSEKLYRKSVYLAKRMLPEKLENMLRKRVPVVKISNRCLALRALIVKEANALLKEDAKLRLEEAQVMVVQKQRIGN